MFNHPLGEQPDPPDPELQSGTALARPTFLPRHRVCLILRLSLEE